MIQKTLFAALTALSLVACGGGGADTDRDDDRPVTPAPTPAPSGSKSAIGVVGGQPGALTFNSKDATITGSVTQNGDPAQPSDVQPGDVIVATVVSDDDRRITLTGVEVKYEAKGALSRVDAASGTLELFSQVIVTDALTRITEENRDDSQSSLTLADLATGDYVEVSGQRQADGRILATRVERKLIQAGDSDFNESELRGPVANLDAGSRTFQIGSQRVDYAQARVEGRLANGAQVEVEGVLNGTTLTAREVEVEDRSSGPRNSEAEIEGPATALNTATRRFTLQGYVVDYSAASVEGQLVEGARVEVEGRFDASDANLLRATEVEVKHSRSGSGSANGEIKGVITAVDSGNRTLEIGSSRYYADDQTVIDRDDRAIPFAELRSGELVEIRFDSNRPLDGRDYAVKIELESDDDDEAQELKGRIADFNAAAKTFTLNGTPVQVTAATRYELDDEDSSESAFFGTDRSGEPCEVKGRFSGGVFTASKVELDD